MKTLSDVISDNEILFREESLILEATELMATIMEENGVSKADLARKLNKTKSYVTQCLSGEQNLTLRTLADFFTALQFQVQLGAIPLSGKEKKPVCRLYPVGGWAYEKSYQNPIINCAASEDSETEDQLCGVA